MQTNTKLDQEVLDTLEVLRESQERDPHKAALGRAAFLAQAQEISKSVPVPVSQIKKQRPISWMSALQSTFTPVRKERSPMIGTLGTLILIFSLVLGGGGATVAAAQQSMPDEMLYPVKTWSEQVRVQLAEKEQTRLQLALELADRRAEEMRVMLHAGEVPPEAVQARWQNQIELALKLAAGQPDDAMAGTLAQIREKLQKQEQQFNQLQGLADPQGEAVLAKIRTMLRERLADCDQGIEDPVKLREQLRERDQDGEPQDGFGPGPNDDPAKPGPGPNEDPGYGPGPNDQPGPGSDNGGYGPGDGSGDGDGAGPGPDCEGYGPGDGSCDGAGPGSTDTGGDNAGPGDIGGDNSGPGDTGGDNSGPGDTGSGSSGPGDTGGDNSGSGDTGGDNSGSGDTGGSSSGSGDNGGGGGSGGGGGN